MLKTAQKKIGSPPSDLYSKQEESLILEVEKLSSKVNSSDLPIDIKNDLTETLHRLNRAMEHQFYQAEFEQTEKYIEWVLALPWNKRSTDNVDLVKAKTILDQNHFGLIQIKERVLEYLAVLKLQSTKNEGKIIRLNRSPVLCFVGLPGTGKTSLASAVAEALGRSFIRIPMGGMGSPLILRGQPRAYPEAEPGMIMRGLRKASTKNPVILLDEIDSVASGAESDIMGIMLELLDPEQNNMFTDYYIDYPFDLSEILFICSANKVGGISSAVMDRLEMITMPRYTEEDKIHIIRDYLLPRELSVVGLDASQVKFTEDVWPHLVKPFGYDIDIRSLQRTLNGVLRKVAKQIVEGQAKEVTITATNLTSYLPTFI